MNSESLYTSFIIVFSIMVGLVTLYISFYLVPVVKWLYKSWQQHKENYNNIHNYHDNGE
jgi:hypothetical protein